MCLRIKVGVHGSPSHTFNRITDKMCALLSVAMQTGHPGIWFCRKIYGEWQGMMKGVDTALFIGTNALIANW